MIKVEKDGIVFTAADGVPADFIAELVDDFDNEVIEEIREELKEKNIKEEDLTYEWERHYKMLKEMVDDIINWEATGTVLAIDKYWKEKVQERQGE